MTDLIRDPVAPAPAAPVARSDAFAPLPAGVTPRDLERAAATFLGRLGPRTLATYRQRLRAFADWLDVPFDGLPMALLARGPAQTTLALEDFRAHLVATLAPRPGIGSARGRGDRPAPSTVNGYLAAVRALVRFLARAHLCSWQLGGVDDEPVTPYRETRGPGPDAVRRLREAAADGADPRLAARDVAILHLLGDLGLRRAELLALALDDVDRDAAGRPRAIRILGKGRADRVAVTLPRRTAAALHAWLALRTALDPAPVGRRDRRPVFVSLDRGAGKAGRRHPRTGASSTRPACGALTPQALARRLAVLGARADVGHVRPHGIRHTAITTLLEAGVPLRDVQLFARHADPRVTQRYHDTVRDVAGAVAETLSALYDEAPDTAPSAGAPGR